MRATYKRKENVLISAVSKTTDSEMEDRARIFVPPSGKGEKEKEREKAYIYT